MKCKECGAITKQKSGICFACEGILTLIRAIEEVAGQPSPFHKGRKLKILKYKITK